MALLDDINQRGDFNASGRGNRAAQGVDYFSNIVPGLQTIQDQLPVDVGFREVQLPNFGDTGRGPQGPGRDLSMDPMSEAEVSAANNLSNVTGSLFGPAGSLIGAGIGYNVGQAQSMGFAPGEPTSISGQTGWGTARGHSLSDSLSTAINRGLEGLTSPGVTVGLQMGTVGPAAPVSTTLDTLDATEGLAGTGVTIGGPIGQSSIQSTDLGALGDGGRDLGGTNGIGMGGDTGIGAGGGIGAGDYADGGPVGLSVPGYADGGPLLAMGFAGGGQIAGMGNPGGDVSPDMINMRVNQMIRNPKFAQMVAQSVQPLMQSGELTPQEVQMMGQIAEASLQNPKLYPQLRQFVAQQGMSPLPPAYDPTTITKILAVTRVLAQSGGGMAQPGQGQATPPGQIPPTDQAQMQNPNGMANGGFLQGPGTGRSDSIGTINETTGQPVKVATGEYVIPEHVVKAKGRDFFDAMLRRYASVPKAGE